MSEAESWLADTQDPVATAQRVLSDVERGLVVVGKAEAVAKRTRPFIRVATVVLLGCVGLGIVVLVSRRRHKSQIEVPGEHIV